MSTIVLQVMDIHAGDKTEEFDSTDPKSLDKMIRFIRDKIIRENFILYGAKKGNELKRLLDKSMKEAESETGIKKALLKNDSFVMREDVKLVMAAPLVGG
jgi:hypothetical protein